MFSTLRHRGFSHSLFFYALAIVLSLASLRADHIKVFLLGGQSNMVGGGAKTSGLPVALQSPQADVLFYYSSPLTTLRPGSGQDFGPEVTFGRTIADAFPSDNFGLIKYAVSGSSLMGEWDKDTGTVYANFRETVTDGLAALTSAGHTYEITGMLWTQGERDARIGRTTAEYEADLNEFIADIRTRYGANLPFFLNRLSTEQTNLPDISRVRAAQERVAADDPFTFLIDADGMSFHDELHFDAAGQIALGEAFGQSYVNSLAPDTTDPTIRTLNPTSGSTDVALDAQLEISFNEPLAFGSGFITIRETAGGTVVERYDVANPPANLTLGGSKITITPGSGFSYSSVYHVEIDATAVDDLAGNSFAGFSDNSTWSFSTIAPDTTEPTAVTLSPANGVSGVPISSNLQISFNEPIAFGSGLIRIRDNSGTLIEAFDVASSASISLNGSAVTITPGSLLSFSTNYYVEMEATAVDDLSGNSFAGFSGSSTWSFTTSDEPPTVGLIDSTGITATASIYNTGGAGFPPIHSIDGSGLNTDTGVHSTDPGTSWFTPNAGDISNEWIQWDLGASYTLGSIHIWNANQKTHYSTNSVDIYYSDSADPGDPEGAGAANWTKLTGTSVTLPQADNTTGYNGFDLETALATSLPTSPIRFVRFELNSSYAYNGAGYTGIAEIRFFTAPVSGPNYANWIEGFGLDALDQDFSDDPDGDGLTNGVEAFFGTNPATSNPGLSLDALDPTTINLSHPNPDSPLDGLTGRYKWSPDLVNWYASDGIEGDGSNTLTAVATPDSPVNNTTTVSATVGGPVLEKLFIQVDVSQEP